MIEIPPRFAGQPPVNSDAQKPLKRSQTWKGVTGLRRRLFATIKGEMDT